MELNSRILLVEDDHCTRELIEEILRDEGYALSAVKNGLEAKELLKIQYFDLLITDFKMPGLNGVELLRWCKNQKIKSQILFMTATSMFVPEESSALTEADATVLLKPLNLDLFLKTIQRTLGRNHSPDLICT